MMVPLRDFTFSTAITRRTWLAVPRQRGGSAAGAAGRKTGCRRKSGSESGYERNSHPTGPHRAGHQAHRSPFRGIWHRIPARTNGDRMGHSSHWRRRFLMAFAGLLLLPAGTALSQQAAKKPNAGAMRPDCSRQWRHPAGRHPSAVVREAVRVRAGDTVKAGTVLMTLQEQFHPGQSRSRQSGAPGRAGRQRRDLCGPGPGGATGATAIE